MCPLLRISPPVYMSAYTAWLDYWFCSPTSTWSRCRHSDSTLPWSCARVLDLTQGIGVAYLSQQLKDAVFPKDAEALQPSWPPVRDRAPSGG